MHTNENKIPNPHVAPNKNTERQAPFFQCQLTINEPGDEYEREADEMADKVMRMPVNDKPFFSSKPLSISKLQRKCKHCEEEEKKVQRKENSLQQAFVSNNTFAYINSLSSRGSTLSESTKSFFEPIFGYDFSNVKVHDDANAASSAQSVNAHAYTVGNNIVFNQNQFSPESDSGKKLLAHELTHVVQQSKSIRKKVIQRASFNLQPQQQFFSLNIGNNSYNNIPLDEALKLLRHFYEILKISIEADIERQRIMQANRDEQYIVGFISDTLGRTEIPPLSIWDDTTDYLLRSKFLLNAGNVERAVDRLAQTEIMWRRNHRRLDDYINGTISGAEMSVTGLTYVKNSAQKVISITANATLGPIVGAIVDKGYTASTSIAQQASEVHHGLRNEVDWKGIAANALIPNTIVDSACKITKRFKVLPSQKGGKWDWNLSPGKRLDGPLEVYTLDPKIASNAKCRGACGPDCKTCNSYDDPDKPYSQKSDDGSVWEYKDFKDCPTHDACRQHDAAFDWCAEIGEKSLYGTCHNLANLECVCKHSAGECVNWIYGNGGDKRILFASSVKQIKFQSPAQSADDTKSNLSFCITGYNFLKAAGDPSPVEGASTLGNIIERIISNNYCGILGCNSDDFFDEYSSWENYTDFLINHNSAIFNNASTQQRLRKYTPKNRPDIVSDKRSRKEFYEIKPMSDAGINAGMKKLNSVRNLYHQFSLPYLFGDAYKSSNIRLGIININGHSFDVFLFVHVIESTGGLIVYQFCYNGINVGKQNIGELAKETLKLF